jgi:hypothetical protein
MALTREAYIAEMRVIMEHLERIVDDPTLLPENAKSEISQSTRVGEYTLATESLFWYIDKCRPELPADIKAVVGILDEKVGFFDETEPALKPRVLTFLGLPDRDS